MIGAFAIVRGWLFAAALASCALAAMPAAAQVPSAEQRIDGAKAAMIGDPQAALKLAGEAELQARGLPDGRGQRLLRATALWLQGEALVRLAREGDAAPKIEEALRLLADVREPIKLRGDLLLARGAVHAARSNPALALADYQAAFGLFGRIGEPRNQSIALQSIASLYTVAGDLASAEKYYRQAAEIYRGDPRLSLFTFNNRGNVLLQLERRDEAARVYRRALEIARGMDSNLLVARISTNLARALIGADRRAEARVHLEEALRLARTPEASAWLKPSLAVAAELALKENNQSRARVLIGQTFAGLDPAKTPLAFRDAHVVAYTVYKQDGRPDLALPHLEALRRLSDEATKVATSTSAALMAARFDFANQELRIAKLRAAELRRRVEAEQAQARFERIIFFGAGGGAIILLVVLSVALVTIRRSRNEVRAANVVLESTNTALEKALAAKTEFLATTSHEIRTPLNGILGMTQVMLADTRTDAATRDRIGIVHGAGLTMRALVDDILDVAKMETGNLTVEAVPVDVAATLRDVTRMWEEQARAKGLGFVLDLADAPGWIESDPGRLRQVVFNLLSNALKFTEKGSVGVTVTTHGDAFRIAVRDSGIGIPAAKQNEIFESFKQADSGTTRKFGGTGLGLTICRNLARALGGDITVESVEGEGSTFTVTLPLVAVDPPADAAPAPGDGGTMVILDRNPIARSMLKTLFEPRVAALQFAATADAAQAILAEGAVRLLLIDEATLKAGEGDAIAALKLLAETARGGGTATAVLWAKPDEGTREMLLAAGVDLVVGKPVAGPALIDAIVPLLQQNSAEKSDAALVSRAA